MAIRKVTNLKLREMKAGGRKIAALTAYDYPTARILDGAGLDIILIGDSAANVVFGYDSTLPVDMPEMLMLSAAVARGVKRAMVVADMPFMSYQISAERALENAGRFIKEARVDAVKLEGGERSLETIRKITDAGIPVMGHLGLTPQSYLQFGGYRIQGRLEESARRLLEDARGLERAGAFAMVLEGIPWKLAGEISRAIEIPTIGIGAGEECDGQILVLHDMIGLGDGDFKFVKRYADVEETLLSAAGSYCSDVRSGAFPSEEHRFEAEVKKPSEDKGVPKA
ncbi:MAG: 3-methyl-2-oxobutanoate hydroxymethyltransferase [bacterium]|nr:3-methyl-2-oxobutanoate hydroxymethyltransferase [bacterium]